MTAPVSAGSVSTRIAFIKRRDELFRPADPVEEARHRPEDVVDGDVEGAGVLELLEHRVGHPVGELVGREEQHRDPVGRRERGTGDHVGRARADRRRHGHHLSAVARPAERRGGVHRPLLVAREVVGQVAEHVVALSTVLALHLGLEQRLPDTGHVAVAEDSEDSGHEPLLDPVALGVLAGQELHECLGGGEPHGLRHGCRRSFVVVVDGLVIAPAWVRERERSRRARSGRGPRRPRGTGAAWCGWRRSRRTRRASSRRPRRRARSRGW